jgi:glycosyltransferase involved in cell wall biosynthesis
MSTENNTEDTAMKIVLVIDTYNDGNGGCVATKRLAEGLRQRGHRISIVSTGASDENSFVVKGTYLPFIRESLEKMQFLFGIPEKEVLRKAFADADIIQIQFPFYLGYGAAKLAMAMGKTVIGTFHVQPQNIIAALGKESALMERILIWFFNFFLLDRAPVIQCPSQFAANLLLKNGSRRPARVVSNGIPNDYVPKEYPRPEWFGDNMVLMNVGRHALEKRQTVLIEGVKRSKYAGKIRLLLCGKGELSNTLFLQGSQLPSPPLVRYVTHEEKLQYLNTADLYVHGSVVELESLACLEAVGCGLPCLIGDSPHSAAPQFALDSRFVFKHDDANDLAAKIDYWYENRAELSALRAQVLAMAEQYRFERCLDKMEELYREARSGAFDGKVLTRQTGGDDGVLA